MLVIRQLEYASRYDKRTSIYTQSVANSLVLNSTKTVSWILGNEKDTAGSVGQMGNILYLKTMLNYASRSMICDTARCCAEGLKFLAI